MLSALDFPHLFSELSSNASSRLNRTPNSIRNAIDFGQNAKINSREIKIEICANFSIVPVWCSGFFNAEKLRRKPHSAICCNAINFNWLRCCFEQKQLSTVHGRPRLETIRKEIDSSEYMWKLCASHGNRMAYEWTRKKNSNLQRILFDFFLWEKNIHSYLLLREKRREQFYMKKNPIER